MSVESVNLKIDGVEGTLWRLRVANPQGNWLWRPKGQEKNLLFCLPENPEKVEESLRELGYEVELVT